MKEYLKTLCRDGELSEEDTYKVFEAIMGSSEAVSDAQIGAYLFATGYRLPTSEEIVGGARALREHMIRVPIKEKLGGISLLDTCGTGGSGLDSFNTSTVVGLVCAGAGQYVAKHGNRAATSKCGGADILSALGVKTDLKPEEIVECISKTHFCFMFAPKHHPATARAAKMRREMGFRTIFNFLGPLVNPAEVDCQLMGVSNRDMLTCVAQSLAKLGSKRVMVVCGEDGLDEITLCGKTSVCELTEGTLREYAIEPEDFGFSKVDFSNIQGGAPEESALRARAILEGQKSAYRDLVLLNAGAALYVSGSTASIKDGIEKSRERIDSGAVLEVLEQVVKVTSSYA